MDHDAEKGQEEKSHQEKVQEEEPQETDHLNQDINQTSDQRASLTQDSTKVKFIPAASSPNGDSNVNIDTTKVKIGLDKEELMKYVNDPFWKKLRLGTFILFWLAWFGMLIGAIVIVVFAPKCPAPPERLWWQKSPIYEVYVRSFKDSNNDGIGDLKGVESKLDYLKDLGVETIWLSPIYKSPMADFGYDIEDYKQIAEIFGTMDDFDSLVAAMKTRGMKLIMDFVPNHTSKKHPWFQKSIEGVPPFADYYIWKNPRNGGRPSNWLSVFGGPAWTYNAKREQYYYHQFLPDQPDLNLRNPKIVELLKDVLKFWLNKGVHGFRVDAVKHMFEDLLVRDEPRSNAPNVPSKDWEYLDHIYTTNQPETFELLAEFRELLDTHNKTDDLDRVMFAEAYGDVKTVMRYYGNKSEPIAHFPFNFALITDIKKKNLDGLSLNSSIRAWLDNMPKDVGWANWVLGNHDVNRVGSRFGTEFVNVMNMVALLLPGTPVTYYGEEIGMTDNQEITFAQTEDPFGKNAGPDRYKLKSRDPERTPMQWNSKANAGFSRAKPWLPINSNYKHVNVEYEKSNLKSHLNIYKQLVELRSEKACMFGNVAFPIVTDELFAFTRIIKGAPGYCVLANLGNNATTVDLSEADGIPQEVSIHIPREKKGSKLKYPSSAIPIEEKSGIVLRFVPEFD